MKNYNGEAAAGALTRSYAGSARRTAIPFDEPRKEQTMRRRSQIGPRVSEHRT